MCRWDRLVLLKHLLEEGVPKTVIADRPGVSQRVIITGSRRANSIGILSPVRLYRTMRPTH